MNVTGKSCVCKRLVGGQGGHRAAAGGGSFYLLASSSCYRLSAFSSQFSVLRKMLGEPDLGPQVWSAPGSAFGQVTREACATEAGLDSLKPRALEPEAASSPARGGGPAEDALCGTRGARGGGDSLAW